MTEQHIPSKAELLEALRSSEQELLQKLRGLPAEEFEQGRYEGGWNARQILAHVASIEWSYPRLLDLARQGAPPEPKEQPAAPAPTEPPPAEPAPSGSAPSGGMRGGVDDYNTRQVEKRAGASVEELLAEFQKNRAATIAAVEGAEEELLTMPIRSAGGIPGALGNVIYALAVAHPTAHVNDIVGGS
jgi:hypothetical protein